MHVHASPRHAPSSFFSPTGRALMASSSVARPPLLLLLLLLVVVLLLSSLPALAASESPAVTAARAGQVFHVATAASPLADANAAKNGAGRRPIRGRRRKAGRGGGTGAWAFSAMLPRGFVPPSGSSACHNDMPATAANAQFFTCGGSGSP